MTGLRCVRRALAELALLVLGMGAAVALEVRAGPSFASAACLSLGLAGAAAGLAVRLRAGELQMAWRCPRLDRLGLRPGSADAPWAVLEAAELALDALGPAQQRFPAFFPGARQELMRAACRAVAAHRRVACARGEPGLEGRAADELARLAKLLKDIRGRLLDASSLVAVEDDPYPQLQALEERCGALAEAVVDEGISGARAPQRQGVSE